MSDLLPANCAACVYRPAEPAPGGLCRRHAPAPGQEEFELVYWPKAAPGDRCGVGAAIGDGTGPGVVSCGMCIHWHQPSDLGVKPDYRRGRPVEWWAASGYCTRLAPAPAAEEGQRWFHRVVHSTDCCGDGGVIEDVAGAGASSN